MFDSRRRLERLWTPCELDVAKENVRDVWNTDRGKSDKADWKKGVYNTWISWRDCLLNASQILVYYLLYFALSYK